MNSFFKRIWFMWKGGRMLSDLKAGRRLPVFKGMDGIRRVLLFWNTPTDVQGCIRELERLMPGVQVDLLCYAAAGRPGPEYGEVACFGADDLEAVGGFSRPEVRTVLETPHDLLVNLTDVADLPVRCATYAADVSFSAGMKQAWETADLVVSGVKDASGFAGALVKVLADIKKI